MKKLLLPLAVSAALAGCGGGETLEDVKQDTKPVTPVASVKFDPSNGVISVPNDILFSGTQDGTLNIPGELDGDSKPQVSRASYADPSLALGGLDGWSTQMPYQIGLNTPSGVTIDAATVAAPGAVRIFEVAMGNDGQTEACAQLTPALACRVVSELTFGPTGDFVSQLSSDGQNINIIPVKPFKTNTTYITVLTTNIKDGIDGGRSLTPSSTYTLLRQEAPLVTDAQQSLQAVIRSYERALVASESISAEEIVYTAAMTTQSTGAVVGSIKQLLAATINTERQPMVTVAEQDFVSVADKFEEFGLAATLPPELLQAAGGIRYLKGNIQLPQYLSRPKNGESAALADTYWQAKCDNGVAVMAATAAAGGQLPEPAAGSLDEQCQQLSGGQLRDLGLDAQKFVTKYNPIPEEQWVANAPVQITFPLSPAPETGFPVVIMQHGITSKKEDMLGLTLALSQAGFATVAIDHPLHGERGIDVDGDGNDEFNASTKSVLHYMNLQSLLVARDNLRQSTADLLALRLGLHAINAASQVPLNFNTHDVSFVGQSLGSIVAPSFIAHANLPFTDERLKQAEPLFKVGPAALSSGGAGIANFLVESGSFGPVVKTAVLQGASDLAVSKKFGSYLQEGAVADCSAFAGSASAFAACAYNTFVANLEAEGDLASIGAINATVDQFAYASQTVLDSADPLNYAPLVRAVNTPMYMSVVVGGEGENKGDQVIPATTLPRNPLGGSTPLAAMMGLETVTESQQSTDGTAGRYVVNFSQGHHSSLLTPSFDQQTGGTAQGHAQATAEMQKQVATYLASKGLLLPITDASVIAK
ncbi:VolA/Pla-1 family phospholipase [Pseudoalteromonas luteoviolacea]|uniref:VolA/Pla-1 family phospholipase n=1 Tax=Pseudoalteromonas luteoviolacea TaxID=43657 RepID=UPI001B37A09E|nr:VolA/Pla-1 family phospholipase [Pseudoalteromonas luteoviolacea]MBQ4835472.1 lipase [Pseudoalteromonas luteoviolacea]